MIALQCSGTISSRFISSLESARQPIRVTCLFPLLMERYRVQSCTAQGASIPSKTRPIEREKWRARGEGKSELQMLSDLAKLLSHARSLGENQRPKCTHSHRPKSMGAAHSFSILSPVAICLAHSLVEVDEDSEYCVNGILGAM
jgi:hypothetical protein